jgi:hypothetical protein
LQTTNTYCINICERTGDNTWFNANKAEKGINMKKPVMPHVMHDEHLCYLVNMGYLESSLKDYKKLVKDAKFVCKNCGRVADSEEYLCQPAKI